jgi:hypothetical protein
MNLWSLLPKVVERKYRVIAKTLLREMEEFWPVCMLMEISYQGAVNMLTYVANECKDDLKAYCSDVAIGKGRLLKCLEKNDAKVSSRCKQARKDVKLEYKE